MANERYGNKYLVLLGEETSGYGTEQTSYTATLPDKVEMKEETSAIEISQKTGDIETWKGEYLAGTKKGTVTISGQLAIDTGITTHGILFDAFFSNYDGTDTFDNPAAGAPQSYTIYQYFTSDSNYNVAVGCVAESLEISGAVDGAIEYSITFRAKSISREESASPPTAPSYTDTEPLLFQRVSVTRLVDITDEDRINEINSFSLTLNNTFADDNLIYQNSSTKSQELRCGFNGQLNVEFNYDSTHSEDVYDHIMGSGLTKGNLRLDDPAVSEYFMIETKGKITEYTIADPDKCIFTNSFTKELMGDDSTAAITITQDSIPV